MWTGKPQETFTDQVVTATAKVLGASDVTAHSIGDGVDMGISLGSAGVGLLQGARGTAVVTDDVLTSVSKSKLGNAPLSQSKIDEIIATPKGQRPEPSKYLPQNYIDEHLLQFNTGASRFMTKNNLSKYGLGQKDGTSFVMTKAEANKLLASANGDKRLFEDALGLPKNYLEGNELVKIGIPKPKSANLRIPSGNEAGANKLWIPGGKLPNGNLEAVIDVGNLAPTKYTVAPLEFK